MPRVLNFSDVNYPPLDIAGKSGRQFSILRNAAHPPHVDQFEAQS
jgi:hypothetical protein